MLLILTFIIYFLTAWAISAALNKVLLTEENESILIGVFWPVFLCVLIMAIVLHFWILSIRKISGK